MKLLRPQFRFLLVVAFAVAGFTSGAIGQTLQIDTLKANYIDGFMDFVRWDGDILRDETIVGVIGSKELVQQLQRVAREKQGDRILTIVPIEIGDDFSHLHALFVGSGNRQHWSALCEASRKHRILLIGEEEGFVAAGGCIEFIVAKNRLRFAINIENVEEHGIEVSSKLIELGINRQ